MKYRKMPNTGDDLSVLGFGCMRFPLDSSGAIDRDLSERMIRHGVERGVNYIDTAWPYHNGESEPFVGEVLSKGLREKVNLATKLPSWLINDHDDMEDFLNKQLERLKTERIDYYLVHALNRKHWDNLRKNDLFSFLEKVKSDGRVGSVGFSFHDEYDVFKDIADGYDWSFCQIQYNFLDTEYQAGRAGLRYAAAKGMGVIVMEPLRGGKLVTTVPDDIMGMWDSMETKRPVVDWALSWVWDHPEVTLLLSGMSSMKHVSENIEYASKSASRPLSTKELRVFDDIRAEYHRRIMVDCTSCGYCMPCPSGVNIPLSFRFLNEFSMFSDRAKASEEYQRFVKCDNRADRCVECGACLGKCPQKIDIISKLKDVTHFLGKGPKG